MKKLLLLVSFVVCTTLSFAQGNMISMTSQLPTEITICGPEQKVTLNIVNPSPFGLHDVVLQLTMPDGINYVPGSVTGAVELDTSNLSTPQFTLANISTQGSRNISFYISANCDVMDFIAQGQTVSVVSRVDYITSNNIDTYDINTSYLYHVKQPNLSIISITNQTYSGNIGDVFTRCITITNGGLGELSNFTFTHTHGNGINVTNVSIGIWNSAGNTETVYFDGNDFTGTGNHNNLFENAEVITICETIEVLNCVSVFSDYEVKWGCEGAVCQTSIATANVVFPNLTPNLNVVVLTTGVNTCLGFGHANTPALRIINNGMGDAYDVFLDIFHATSTIYYNSGLISNIDPGSFTMQVNSNAPVSITPTQTFNNSSFYCLSPNPKGRVYLNIPVINSHDTVIIRWVYYNCCANQCGGTRVISGWRYQGSYKSICDNNYVIPNAWGYSYKEIYGDLVNDLSPSNITSGETKNFSFLFSSYGVSYPSTTGRYWKFVVLLPRCLNYAGNFLIQSYTGTQFWYPTTVNVSGDTLTAIFNNWPPFTLFQSVVKFDLSANCANAGCNEGGNTLSIKSYFIPDGSCGCEVNVSCLSITVGVICPVTCEGLNNKGFETYRSSYGSPDNDNNGLADPLPATLNFGLIRRDRAMYNDTITTLSKSTVKTSLAHPNWNYFYRIDSILNGNRLEFIDGYLEIFQHSTGNVYTCNVNPVLPITTVGTTRKFKYDVSPVTLSALGYLPAGFTLNDGDSIAFKVRYRVNSNTGGAILDCFVKNKMFVSDVPNPTSFAHKFGCNVFEGRFSIIGFYYTNWGPDNFSVNTCNTFTISQNYYLSIGPCCQNYAGGNLFPFEYRNWAHPLRFRVVLPHGYQFISAVFNQVRTAGTTLTSNSGNIGLSPVNPNSDTLVFWVESFFQTFGGSVPLSDDGFYGTLSVTLAPTCNVVSNVTSGIGYLWDFAPSGSLSGYTANTSYVTTHDYITYQGPDIFLQSSLPSILAYNDEVSWDISLSNTTNYNAMNTWFSGDQTTGVTILQVWDLDNNVLVSPVGNIYQIGTLPGNVTRNFRIIATYSSCFPSTMMVYAGWNCNAGYPATVASYPCTAEQILLSLEPQVPNLIANVSSPFSTVDLCDTAGYVVEGINVQLGTAYNLKLKVVLPAGVSIIPGSSKLSYPAPGAFVNIPDPTWIAGTQWQWDLSAINALIGTDGLPGILDTAHNSVKISFKVMTDCNYTSGSVIGFNFHGQSHCGNYTGQEITMSSQLAITGATEPYLTDIHVNTSYVSPCAFNSTRLKIKVVNNGPLPTGTTDSISLTFPEGIFYIPNSFVPVDNAPVNPVPVTEMPNNMQIVTWRLPQNTQAGDSVVFEIYYYCVADVVECGIYYIDAMTYSSRNLLCQLTGQNCDILVSTGSAQIPIYIYKSYLSLSDASAWSVPNGSNQETVYTGYTISNNGESIISNHTVYLSYFNDADGNQMLSSPDNFLGSDAINVFIDTNSVNPFTSQINVPAGNSCKLLFVLDTTANGCICDLNQIYANVPLLNAGPDTVFCAGQSAYIGMPPTNGYTYQWQPSTGLDNPNSSRPLFTGSNTGTTPVTLTYILTTNRITCTTRDTVVIVVRPIPVVNANIDQDIGVCPSAANAPLNGSATGSAPLVYSWTATTGLSNPNIPDPVADPLVTTTYTLTVTDTYGCSASDDVMINVHPLPTAVVSIDQNIGACPTAASANLVCIATGTPPVTFSWLPATGLSNPNDANTIADPFSTTIYTVTVADTFGCTATDVVIVTVDPLPAVNAGTDQYIGSCPNAANANLNAVATGTAPLTYSWLPIAGLSNPGITNPLADPASTTTYTLTVTDTYGCTATDAVLITVDPLPTVNAGNDQNLGACPNAANANLNAVATGTTPLTYSWLPAAGLSNPNIANPVANPANTTTYTVTVSDTYGCTVTDAVLITVDPLPTSNAGTDQHIGACINAANANLAGTGTGTGPLVYSWLPTAGLSNPNIANPVADPASTTTYTLTVTDTYGCTATDAVVITVDPIPTCNAGTDQHIGACINAANANLSGTGTGTGPLVHTWLPTAGLSNPNIANPVADPASTTTYTLTVTDTYGCIATDAVLITVDPLPTVNAGNDQNLGACPNASNANLNAVATGTTPLTYSWLPAAGLSNPNIANPVANPANTTTYIVTVTDTYGCTVTDGVLITVDPLPTSNAGTDQHIGACINAANANLSGTGTGTGPLIYSWLPTAGLSNPNIANPVADPASTTTYTLTVTDTYGCTATDAVLITVDPLPTSNAGTDQHIGACINAANSNLAGTGTGIGPLVYSWLPTAGLSNPNIANPVADPASTTTYTLTVTDAYGCTATDAVLITVDPLPTANAGTDHDLGACLNAANVNLNGVGTGTGPLVFAWLPNAGLSNPNIANPVADPASSTTYTLTVTDTYGCTATDAVLIIVDPLPTVNAGNDQNLGACPNAANANLNAVATGTTPLTYSWLPAAGISNTNIANPVANPANTTTYTVTVTDTYGCTVTDAVLITVDPLPTSNAGTDQHIGACINASNANLAGTGTGTGPLVYSWLPTAGLSNPNIANPVADPASTTTYTLTVTNTYGCAATDAVLITVDPLPTANAGTDQDLGACLNAANANLNGVGTGTGPLVFAWLPNAGLSNPNIANPVADPASTTTYTLTVTDTYGCTATDAVLITVDPLPTVNAGNDQNLGACPNAANANLNAVATGTTPLTYSWLPADGLSNPNIANPVANPANTTTYTVTVTDTYSCTATDAVVITVDPIPTCNAGTDQHIGACINAANANLSGTGTGTGPLVYSWLPTAGLSNPNIANPVADPASTTTYTLTVTDTYGCTATDAVVITVDPLPTANAGTDQHIGACINAANANLAGTGTGTGPLIYSWLPTAGLSNPNIANPVADTASTTTYTLTVTDLYGCTATDAVLITVDPLPTADAGTDQYLGACIGAANANLIGTGTGTGPLVYTWLPTAGLSNPNIANPVADPASTTTYTLTVTDLYGCTATDAVLITVDPLPTVNAGNDQSLGACPNAANANLNAVATGTTPLTYSWLPAAGLSNPNIANPVANPANTTTYTITVTDTYGCTATDAVLITVDPLPTVNAGNDQNLGACPNAANANLNAVATGTAPLTYSWLPIAGLSNPYIANPVADPAFTTTYTLTVTDTYGCIATDAVVIIVDPLPTANAGNDQHIGACINAANANLAGTGTGTGPLVYSWLLTAGLSNPNIADPVADPASTTTYTLTVTDTYGCTVTDAIIITVDPLPTVDAGVDQNIGTCPNAANASINSVSTGTTPLVYSWLPTAGLSNPNIANPVANPANTTTYTVTVTDTYGCTVTDDILIAIDPLPTIDAGPDQNIGACPNAANAYINTLATGTATLTYLWAPANGLSNPGIVNPFADPINTTTYSVTVTDTYGCTATDAVVITVNPLPTANAGTDQVLGACAWAANTFLNGAGTGTAPLSYSWSPLTGLSDPYIGNPAADPQNTTTYTLTITDAFGCTATDAVTITVNNLPVVSVTADTAVICATFSSNLTAYGAVTYYWSPGLGLSSNTGPNVTATPTSTTTYTVTGTDIYTCTASAQITITVNPNPIVTVTPASSAICFGDSVTHTASGAASYLWMPAIGLSSSVNNVVVASPDMTTTYSITGTTLGCTGTSSVTVTVNPLPVVTLNPFSDVCLNDNAFTLTQGIPAGGIYSGDGITGTDNFYPLAAGVGTHLITYTYTDNNTCVNSDTQTIKVKPNPIMTVTPDSSDICRGTSVVLFATGADTYSWSPAGTLSDSTGSPVTATPVSSSTIYTVTGNIDGCTSSVAAIVHTYTTIPVYVTPDTDSLCPGGSTTLTASGAYQYIWQPPLGLSTNTEATVVCTPEATTTYTVLGTDTDGCTGTATAVIVIFPEAFLEFTIVPEEGCTPLFVEFNYTPDGTLDMNTLHWDFGDTDTTADVSDQPDCSYTYDEQGNYIVVLTATSVHGCHAIGSDTIIVYQTPTANFYPTPEIGRSDDPVIHFYDQSNNAQHWFWDFGDPASLDSNTSYYHNAVHQYSDTGSYMVMLVVSNIFNCTDTSFRTVKIIDPYYFWVPNAFTPNGDAMNDVFMGQGVGFREDGFEMSIYDRWGELIFDTKDSKEAWDGLNARTGKKCAGGVYVWIINIIDESSVQHKLKGNVTLVR